MEAAVDTAMTQWDKNHQKQNYRRRFIESFPPALKHLHKLHLGGASPFVRLKQSVPAPVKSAVELAGGRGDLAIAMCKAGIAQSVDLYDISAAALAQAADKASAQGYDIRTFQSDVNKLELEASYDLAVFSRSLHHIEALEHVLANVRAHLNPGGILYVNDYIGPSRMQWTDKQLNVMNGLLGLLPEEKRIHIDSGKVKEKVDVLPVEVYLAEDPSEGVRSADIRTVLENVFPEVDYKPIGGTISYELFRGIIHNFSEDNPEDVKIVTSVLDFEHDLIRTGLLPSDFGLFFCRG